MNFFHWHNMTLNPAYPGSTVCTQLLHENWHFGGKNPLSNYGNLDVSELWIALNLSFRRLEETPSIVVFDHFVNKTFLQIWYPINFWQTNFLNAQYACNTNSNYIHMSEYIRNWLYDTNHIIVTIMCKEMYKITQTWLMVR